MYQVVIGSNEKTFVLPLAVAKDGKVEAGIELYGPDSTAYTEAELSIDANKMQQAALRGRALDATNPDDAKEILTQRYDREVALYAAVTKGWFGLSADGKEFPYSPENAENLYRADSTLRARVFEALSSRANFLK